MKAASSNHESEAERFRLERIDHESDVPSGTLEKSFKTNGQTLQDALVRLEAKRQGKTVLPVVVSNYSNHNLTDLSNVNLSNLNLSNNNLSGSNNTLDTLNSSIEMLTHEQAAKLSPTNAPIMQPYTLKPISVKSHDY